MNMEKSITKGFLLAGIFFATYTAVSCNEKPTKVEVSAKETDSLFVPPDTSTIPHDMFGDMVRYGRDLVLNTAYYLGPDGTKGHYLGNKMNCTNCHLDAGTRPFGLNFFSTHARYPQYRGREDKILSLAERVNNCIERPHNGTPMPLDGKEMEAIICYIKWVGTNVPVGHHVKGDEAIELEYPNKPANSVHGAEVFAANCASCHGADGAGKFTADSVTYVYPPLWGRWGFEEGSSLHRIIKAAKFIKANMPNNIATWRKPALSDEDALDVAAYLNCDTMHDRPHRKGAISYPNINTKPIDYDSGPYPDTFSALQHKYGPYKPIIEDHKKRNIPVVF